MGPERWVWTKAIPVTQSPQRDRSSGTETGNKNWTHSGPKTLTNLLTLKFLKFTKVPKTTVLIISVNWEIFTIVLLTIMNVLCASISYILMKNNYFPKQKYSLSVQQWHFQIFRKKLIYKNIVFRTEESKSNRWITKSAFVLNILLYHFITEHLESTENSWKNTKKAEKGSLYIMKTLTQETFKQYLTKMLMTINKPDHDYRLLV